MAEPTEDARHRYYGRDPVPGYWAAWGGPIEARGSRVCLISSQNGAVSAWKASPKITSSLDEAIGFIDHVLPGCPYVVFRRRSGRFGATVARGPGDETVTAADTAARALVLAVLAALDPPHTKEAGDG